MTRLMTLLAVVFALTLSHMLPANAQEIRPRVRPNDMALAMSTMRSGDWDQALKIAEREGAVARDVIEWMRLRAGRGNFAQVRSFLDRRNDWPGEAFLRRKSEPVVIKERDNDILAFFTEMPPQTPRGVLAHAEALARAGETGEAEVRSGQRRGPRVGRDAHRASTARGQCERPDQCAACQQGK